jgi:Spy/CpxP family protein refolding chaperone
MKKILAIAVCLMISFAAATAQQPGDRNFGTPEERVKIQTARLDSLLTLTADQKTKIEAVHLDLSKKTDAAFRNSQGSRENRRAEMEKLTAEREKHYKTILTDEQYKKYSDNRGQLRERRGQGRGR